VCWKVDIEMLHHEYEALLDSNEYRRNGYVCHPAPNCVEIWCGFGALMQARHEDTCPDGFDGVLPEILCRERFEGQVTRVEREEGVTVGDPLDYTRDVIVGEEELWKNVADNEGEAVTADVKRMTLEVMLYC
jgi:hypothetical protein